MNELEKHFPTQMNLLKEISDKFKRSQNEIHELNEIVAQLKNTNTILQESEAKLNEKIHNYNNQIYNDTKIINDYYKMKNENGILKTENESLKNFVYNLEQKIKQIEIENKRNIENIKNNFKTKENALENQIELLQASNTLDNFEKETDIKNIKFDYEQKLENALKREQSLKIELFDLKKQMTSSNSDVLNQKIFELQEKNKSSLSNYGAKNTNFISAKNILNIKTTSNVLSSNSSNASRSDYQRNNKTATNQMHNNTQIQNTVNINNIEINPVKKFHFRKPHHGSVKQLLSEDFDPFKMHKETSSSYSYQKDSSHTDSSCNIIDNSLVEEEVNIRGNQQKINDDDYNEDFESYVVQCETTSKKNNNNSNYVPKKRKLFDPNNFDYLE